MPEDEEEEDDEEEETPSEVAEGGEEAPAEEGEGGEEAAVTESFSRARFGASLFLWPFTFPTSINFSGFWCGFICPK